MKTFKIILISLILMFFFSCEENLQIVNGFSLIDCNKCTADEPLRVILDIKLEKLYKYGSANTIIYIDVYEGNLEDDVLFRTFQTSNTETSVTVPVNKKYTFTATYSIDGNVYVAVNSVTPRVKYNKESCEEPCYYVAPRSVNLSLKYTK